METDPLGSNWDVFFPSPHPPPGSATQRREALQAVLCTRPHELPPTPHTPRSVRSVLVLFVEIKSAVGDELSVDGGEPELFYLLVFCVQDVSR